MNIEAKNLSKIYGDGENRVVALDRANLEIVSSDFISIMGPSGSGKSTLLHLLSGLDKPSSGSLTYDGKDKLKIQMSAKRQEIEKTRRLIRGLYENFVQGILTNDEYFELKADYEYAINALSGEIEVFEKSMDSLDNQLARYRAMEKDAKTLAQDHVLTAELIERLIERIEIDHERNIHVTFRFKNEFQGKAVELCATM